MSLYLNDYDGRRSRSYSRSHRYRSRGPYRRSSRRSSSFRRYSGRFPGDYYAARAARYNAAHMMHAASARLAAAHTAAHMHRASMAASLSHGPMFHYGPVHHFPLH